MSRSRPSCLCSLASLLLVVTWLGCSPSDVDNQNDPAPVAVAEVVAVGPKVGNAYKVRAGSDAVITGKDSYSDGPPILEWEWTQTAGPPVQLYERTVVARAFTAPQIASTLQFQLTVTNSKGKQATTLVNVQVVPVLDADDYLLDPSIDEELSIFVSPDTAISPVPMDIRYTITVTPIVHWTDRNNTPRTQALPPILTASDQIDAGFVVPANPVDPAQDRIPLPVPMLDADDVNVFFQGANRDGRLEIEALKDATVELQVDLTGDTGRFQVYAARPNGSTFTLIDGADLLSAGMAGGSGSFLDGNAGPFTATLDLEKIRQELGISSRLAADNYYACIDPNGEAKTLSEWKTNRGFDNAVDVVNANYVNNYDLGFGREMHLRQDANGDIYSYVVNYPSLEQLLKGVNEFATVAMEWSAKPMGTCDAPTFSPTERIVKFYTFVLDEKTGEMVRSTSINFDGRGERFMPGVCTACHDGSITNIAALGNPDLSMIDADNVDLSASFMPWDIDSLLFARASDPDLVDPDLNGEDIPEATLQAASLQSQQAALRALNEGTLQTYVDDPLRYEAPLRLIHGWYGNAGALPSDLTTAMPSTLTSLPPNDFDGTYVQPGWAGQEQLYFDVFARNCRMCHTQQDNLSKNFDTYAEFIGASSIPRFVYERGVMPVARLTYDRFWVDYKGSSTPPAELLRDHLINVAGVPNVPPTAVPGQPVPEIDISDTLVQAIDGAGELVPTIIDLDGSNSLFAKSYDWTITDDTPCGSPPPILGASSPQASFVVDQSPCDYTVTLEIDSGITTARTSTMLSTDRIPQTVSFGAPLTGYTPGDAFVDIDVLSQISAAQDGDGTLELFVNAASPPYNLTPNANVTDLGGGVVRYLLPTVLGGTTDSFEYTVEDLNDTLAPSPGLVTLNVASIEPTVTLDTSTETSATIQWTVPAGFVADRYIVERDGPILDGFTSIGTTSLFSFFDPGLQSGATYEYRVLAQIDVPMEESTSNVLQVDTQVGVPTGLMATTSNSVVNLSWTQGAGTAPDSYDVYRNLSPFSPVFFTSTLSPALFDNTVEQNTTYNYQVAQLIGMVSSNLSSVSSFTTDADPPGSFNAVATFNTSDQVSLTWSGPVDGNPPSSYNVYRGGALITTTTNTFYTDGSRSPNTTYSYQVGANGLNGESLRSSDSATTYPSLNQIATSLDGDAGCLGCHFLERYRLENVCIRNDLDLTDCSPANMSGVTITSGTRSLVQTWANGGFPD